MQGFSDEGFATDFELIKNENEVTHVNVLEAILTKVSLVDIPPKGAHSFKSQMPLTL